MIRSPLIFGAFVLVTSSVRADHVHLAEGRVLEGTATVEGDKVVVALESGSITVPLHEVTKIDRGVTPLAEAGKREAALRPGDLPAILTLANYCRDHDLFNKEHDLLSRIIALSPDHAEARRRLGFVRQTQNGHEVWLDRTEVVRREQEDRLAHRQAQVALDQREAALGAAQIKLQQDRAREQQLEDERIKRANSIYAIRPFSTYGSSPSYVFGAGSAYGYGYAGYSGSFGYYGGGSVIPLSRPSGPPPFGINGVRDPSDMSFAIPGVRSPASYFDGAFRPH